MISVIIPAYNEEGFIGECLSRVLASDTPDLVAQIIVVANGCRDATADMARHHAGAFAARGWRLDVLELVQGSKVGALNAGDRAAIHNRRVYLDADVWVSPGLLGALAEALNRDVPIYASGRPEIRTADSFVSRRYARFWQRLPFMAEGVPGCGVYAVNGPGRARWGDFPDVTADDTFVRYHFATSEMTGVPHGFSWPITEGFADLVRVRRRQDRGLAEMRARYPRLAGEMAPTAPGTGRKLRLLARDPVGFVIYAAVALTVRTPLFRDNTRWARGR